jgi:hypothetical protein
LNYRWWLVTLVAERLSFCEWLRRVRYLVGCPGYSPSAYYPAVNSLKFFPVATGEEFRDLLLALAASERINVLHALRQRHFKPAFAAILSAEHLAIACRDVDLLGVSAGAKIPR